MDSLTGLTTSWKLSCETRVSLDCYGYDECEHASHGCSDCYGCDCHGWCTEHVNRDCCYGEDVNHGYCDLYCHSWCNADVNRGHCDFDYHGWYNEDVNHGCFVCYGYGYHGWCTDDVCCCGEDVNRVHCDLYCHDWCIEDVNHGYFGYDCDMSRGQCDGNGVGCGFCSWCNDGFLCDDLCESCRSEWAGGSGLTKALKVLEIEQTSSLELPVLLSY